MPLDSTFGMFGSAALVPTLQAVVCRVEGATERVDPEADRPDN